jgi:hypothetical protein
MGAQRTLRRRKRKKRKKEEPGVERRKFVALGRKSPP